jgi:hypothetical protein
MEGILPNCPTMEKNDPDILESFTEKYLTKRDITIIMIIITVIFISHMEVVQSQGQLTKWIRKALVFPSFHSAVLSMLLSFFMPIPSSHIMPTVFASLLVSQIKHPKTRRGKVSLSHHYEPL